MGEVEIAEVVCYPDQDKGMYNLNLLIFNYSMMRLCEFAEINCFISEVPIEEVMKEASAREGPTYDEQKKVRLDDLFSVAEALERSNQPDFCDVTDTAARVEGSATHREIIRDCLLCGKQLFGRHALSRHMRNAHSRVFGPYSCPVDGCGKNVEDGVAFKSHLQNNHFGPRAKATAKHEK